MLKGLYVRAIQSWRTTGVGVAGTLVSGYCASGHPMDLKAIGAVMLPVVVGILMKDGVLAAK